MAGGRPQPGHQIRRPATPTTTATTAAQWQAEFVAAGGEGAVADGGHRAFEFSFESAVRLPGGAHAPVAAMTSPVAAAVVVAGVAARGEVGGLAAAGGTAEAMGMGVGFGAVGSPGFVSLAALPRAQGPDAGVAAGALRVSPAPLVGGLYGQTYLVGQGRTHFDPSARMDSW